MEIKIKASHIAEMLYFNTLMSVSRLITNNNAVRTLRAAQQANSILMHSSLWDDEKASTMMVRISSLLIDCREILDDEGGDSDEAYKLADEANDLAYSLRQYCQDEEEG